MALALATPVHATDADNDGIEDSVEGYYAGISNGFEHPQIGANYVLLQQQNVPDWQTTASDGRIEIWRTDFRNVPSYEGGQHAELNASEEATLFAEMATIPGSVLSWKIAHRGRDGTDTATVSAGAPGEAGTLLDTMITGPNNWSVYSGTYTVPTGQTTTRFSFTAVDKGSVGNFVDAFEVTGVSRDSDLDGTPDYQDTDSDDDGIPDSFETSSDTDGDGTANYLDLDSDEDGISDTTEGNVDTDSDGAADYLDTDSDDDGLLDIDEGVVDTDGDTKPDFQDTDSDADTIPDSVEGMVDTDTDGMADYVDTDSDDDGIPDAEEGTTDTDGDNSPDFQDTDSDADGIPDAVEGNVDTDADGDPNYLDTDSDNDGVDDSEEGVADADGDGVPDYLVPAEETPTTPVTPTGDTDSDEDGIPDEVEGTVDTDGDGSPDANDTDSDNDGIPDQVEAGSNAAVPVDSDGDGIVDYLDLDSDNDGIPDAVEGSSDLDSDGTANYLDLDVDNDGILDIIEAHSTIADAASLDADQNGVIDGAAAVFGLNGLADAVEVTAESGQINYEIVNSDRDSRPDYKDLDSDNDGIFDVTEMRLADIDLNGTVDTAPATYGMPADQDNDGVTDFRDLDSDNDGLTDIVEAGSVDSDGDGRVDNFEDTDNDGVGDSVVSVVLADLDGDGLTNQLDLDSDQDSLPDLLEAGGIDADANGVLDMFEDTNGDGLADAVVATPLLADDSDGDGAPDYLDLDSDNDGIFDLVAAGNVDTDNDGAIDSFTDPDNDGLFGTNPNPTEPTSVPNATRGVITGVSGGPGCSLSDGRTPVDPIFPGMLLLAGLGFAYRRKNRS